MPRVAVVHDYLTQRGGAERVVLSMLRAFPDAAVYTSLYLPGGTFPEFAQADIRALPINRLPLLRRHHRLALPFLAWAFQRLEVTADVVLCSSSGWAHGVRVNGRKIVYCYTPARWLYQPDRYLRGRSILSSGALAALRPLLLNWDRRAARTAHRYLTLSTVVAERIRSLYGMTAEVVPPPHTIDPNGLQRGLPGLSAGFFLCVSRLLPYKNVDALVDAFAGLPEARLVVVGSGPDLNRLQARASANVHFAKAVPDDELRWLFANCVAVVSAAYEDYGLTPLEAAAFGKPSAVLRWGGFLDTVIEGVSGVFFDHPEPLKIRAAVQRLRDSVFRPDVLLAHADRYSEGAFIRRLQQVVTKEMPESRLPGEMAATREQRAVEG